MKKNVTIAAMLSILLLATTANGYAQSAQNDAPSAGTSTTKKEEVVYVYGPGGPLGPIKELAERFSKTNKLKVEVTAGPEANWVEKAKKDADVVFGGSEYMLQEMVHKYPGLIDEKTRTSLYPRAAGILVRKGNPKKIQGLQDLSKPGIKIIDVNGAGQLGLWEDLAGRQGLIPDLQQNIATSVKSSADAIALWKSNSELDAWITYESWHYRLTDETDLIRLPETDKLYRGTPIAVTQTTDNKKTAQQFIAYLKTDEAHQVFQKWGWK
ncbi:extracellular solute-binding protein [Brevibacillus choshinensis]|uniref:extracellular solute-binding protein n=1 Tax=Brevibacillus choshinensis TaxID=54911 RepID=UPI002E1A16BF|nr:extracellular solute-binding protein [Brevibacillus choshinensis]MED4782134.1 extracellular solute-binding protein [Brevibacillus choshinensis]